MPTPRKGESEKNFVNRCVPIVIREGTAKDGTQGSAICHSMYRQHQRRARGEAFTFDGDYVAGDGYMLDVFVSSAEYFMYEAAAGRSPTTVQTLIMSKTRFKTKAEAKTWAQEHGFKNDDVRETSQSWRLRQKQPSEFNQTSFRILAMTRGVQAVVGRVS